MSMTHDRYMKVRIAYVDVLVQQTWVVDATDLYCAMSLIGLWFTDGTSATYEFQRKEQHAVILDAFMGVGPISEELEQLLSTLPSEIRSRDWPGIYYVDADYTDSRSDADRVAMQLSGEVDLYEFLIHRYNNPAYGIKPLV